MNIEVDSRQKRSNNTKEKIIIEPYLTYIGINWTIKFQLI